MERKPALAADYSPSSVQLAQAASLYVATRLGDLRDDIVIVGGLVPSLLLAQFARTAGSPAHVGTLDVDLGLGVALLNSQRYHELCERLRSAGFHPDVNESGNPTNQRWRIEAQRGSVTIDFLIPDTSQSDKGGTLRHLEAGFAAIITPGLELAFEDKRLVTLSGETLRREQARRDVWVCEAGAFSVLKALAFQARGESKDAYDLVYVLQNYGSGIQDVFRRLQPLLTSPPAKRALTVLERDFTSVDSLGALRVAEFLGDPQDETIRADAAGAVRSLLALCRMRG
jgi:hypothetical protein